MARRGRGRPRDASLEFHWLGEWGGGGVRAAPAASSTAFEETKKPSSKPQSYSPRRAVRFAQAGPARRRMAIINRVFESREREEGEREA